MGKVIIHGVKEDGLFDAEVKSTATLVTELIDRYTKMCEADIYSALDEIRKSAEQDARARKIYAQVIQEKNKREKSMKGGKLIVDAIEEATLCIRDHKEDTAITILELCNFVVGETFQEGPTPEK